MGAHTGNGEVDVSGRVRVSRWVWLPALIAAALLLAGCTVGVPDVRGMSVTEATKAVQSGGMVLGGVVYDSDLTAEPGVVIRQSPPAGDAASKYDPVKLTVSRGREGSE